ncbi:MAG: PQQ-dependent sugar dehydrogenase [Candidatus Tectomicrobia bacterium]
MPCRSVAKLMVGLLCWFACNVPVLHADIIPSAKHRFQVEVVTGNLRHPWGMAFLPGGDILVTERAGRLRLIKGGRLLASPIAGLPRIKEKGQGGLLGITLHPDFQHNRWVYLSYAGKGKGGYGTEVLRGRLNGLQLHDVQIIFRALPKSGGGRHFGSRLVFGRDGSLYISLGDRGKRLAAQDLNDHRGSLIRLNDDGSVPSDNPFVGKPNVKPDIFTYGNRNMQGMVLHPFSGDIWAHEHGPQGGDEINIMQAGVNYGWPIITYGVNYGSGTKIGEGTHKAGMAQPIYKWVPSIAPSGMMFYTGNQFPGWQGNLFLGSLKFGLLVRLEVDGNRITSEERLLNDRYGRIRDVVQGPDGYLYLLTDKRKGQLLRITPASSSGR